MNDTPASVALRYVVLRHDGIESPHFDLMFETAPGRAMLLTFRSMAWPIERETPVERLPDHRRDYLTYEGPVSGNRGQVHRVASGIYHGSMKTNGSNTLVLEPDAIRLRFSESAGQWTVRREDSSH